MRKATLRSGPSLKPPATLAWKRYGVSYVNNAVRLHHVCLRYVSHAAFAIGEHDATARAMLRFRQLKALQKFTSVHGAIHNHFNQDRQLVDRQTFKLRRSAALAEWQSLYGLSPRFPGDSRDDRRRLAV